MYILCEALTRCHERVARLYTFLYMKKILFFSKKTACQNASPASTHS